MGLQIGLEMPSAPTLSLTITIHCSTQKLHIFSAMASLCQRQNQRPTIAPQSPHFFKILLPETLQQEKLKIPKKFVRKYGNTLLGSVFLEVPSGRVWQIDLARYDDCEVWLENGWKQFVEHYSLGPGHLVAFRYEGNSKFCAFIYDLNVAEINYQPDDARCEYTESISAENVDDSNMQTSPPKRKRTISASETESGDRSVKLEKSEENLQMVDFAGCGVCIGHQRQEHEVPVSLDFVTLDEKARALQRATGNDTYFSPTEKQYIEGTETLHAHHQRLKTKVSESTRALTSEQRAMRLQKAKAFESRSPFFTVVMQPSYIEKWFKLNIPSTFARRHFAHGNGDAILFTSDGRTWPAKYKFDAQNTKRCAELHCGWKTFVKDNDLKVDDVCVFELQKGVKVILRVVIFRETDNTNPPSSQLHEGVAEKFKVKRSTDSDTEPKDENASFVDDLNPYLEGEYKQSTHKDQANHGRRPSSSHFPISIETIVQTYQSFRVVMSPAYLQHGSVGVPKSFARKIFMNGGCIVKLCVADRLWPVKLTEYEKYRRVVFSRGWSRFVKQNDLRVGDACEFLLVDEHDGIIEVSISRVSS